MLFKVRICSFPLFESTPYLRTANISEPPFRGLFAGFSWAFPAMETPLNHENAQCTPPKFGIISQEYKEMREKRKNTPFLKKSPGEKLNTPLFLQFSGRTLSHEKYPFTGHFGNTHGVIPAPEWGGGGGITLLQSTPGRTRVFCFRMFWSIYTSICIYTYTGAWSYHVPTSTPLHRGHRQTRLLYNPSWP